MQRPSDLGYSDAGYDLPKLNIHYHMISADHRSAGFDRKTNLGLLFRDSSLGLPAAAKERRDTLGARIEKMLEIIATVPGEHVLLWHDLESERHAITKALPETVEVYGSQDLELREQNVIDFSNGNIKYLATKPRLSGSGCNFQRYCNTAIFLGINYKFNDFIQSVHRIHRFLQTFECDVHIIYADSEKQVLRTLQGKWQRHDEMVGRMSDIIKQNGLANVGSHERLHRSIGVERAEVRGEKFIAVNNDCVDECRRLDDNSVDLIHTSIPFSKTIFSSRWIF